jgi:hypothetical protein
MVHVRNNLWQEKDVSGRNQYHNAHFRDSALLAGLECSFNPVTGYAHTRLGERARKVVESVAVDFKMIKCQ